MRARLLLTLAIGSLSLLQGQRVGVPTDDLTSLNVEELFQLEVTSVGKKAQQLSRAPAAVFVLTAEDIRRSGATSIPEALQWVPGLTVLPVDGRSWAISARGSARLYADKILVLVDGRSLYTPLFSGVIWEFLNIPLENVEQIEIVRGPGSVMWGPNAINGVINIITRSASATKAVHLSASVGTDQKGAGFASLSGAVNERLSYRVWAKAEARNPAFSSVGEYMFNGSHYYRDPRPIQSLDSRAASAGLRVDSELTARDQLTVLIDGYGANREEMLGFPVIFPGALGFGEGNTTSQGGSAQVRWTRTSSAGNEGTLQFSLDKQRHDYPFVEGDLNNLAVDYQSRRTWEHNEFFWGVGYQQYWDETISRRFVAFQPASDIYRVTNITARNELQLIPKKLTLSAGVRVDYSLQTRFELQPSLRLLYTPSNRQSIWAAVSRAARIPNRFDRAMLTDAGHQMIGEFPVKIDVVGSTSMPSESEVSAEAGYRFQSGQRWSVDTTVFWSYYPRLRSVRIPNQPELSFTDGIPAARVRIQEENAGKGRSYGSETWGTIQVRPGWRLSPSYSYLHERQWTPNATALYSYDWLFFSNAMRHQALIRSQHDITKRWQLDLMARARTRNTQVNLPGLLLADARLAFRPTRETEVGVTVRNVTNRQAIQTLSEAPFVAIPQRRTVIFGWTQRL